MSSPISVVNKKKKLLKLNQPNQSSLTRHYQELNSSLGPSTSSASNDVHFYHQPIHRDEIRLKELEEARARLGQMEKSMQWYSECTANWREKWSRVKYEKDKAKHELKLLKNQLELSNKELSQEKAEKNQLKNEIAQWKSRLNELNNGVPFEETRNNLNENGVNIDNDSLKQLNNLSIDDRFKDKQFNTMLSLNTNDSDSVNCHDQSSINQCKHSHSTNFTKSKTNTKSRIDLEYKLAKLEIKLEELTKSLENEKREKNELIESIDKLKLEHNSLRFKYKKKNRKPIDLNAIDHLNASEGETKQLNNSNESEEENNPFVRLLRIKDQLEQLMKINPFEENSTEKDEFDEELRKFQEQTVDIEAKWEKIKEEDEISRKSLTEFDLKEYQEIKNELKALKQGHNQLKKVFQEKCNELSDALKKVEHCESENRKLRAHLDESKKDLASAEDEIDFATNTIRKLQKINDELQGDLENFHSLGKKPKNSQEFTLQQFSIQEVDDSDDPQEI